MAEMSTAAAAKLPLQLSLESHLTLQRFEGIDVVQSIEITSEFDGTITLSSRGKLPRGMVRNLFQFRNNVVKWGDIIQQDVVVVHEGHRIAFFQSRHPIKPILSIHWWSILRYAVTWIR